MKAYAYRPGIGVKASKIVEVTEPETDAGKAVENFSCAITLEDGIIFYCTPGMVARMTPKPGDYLVETEDGYKYLNPKEVFENKFMDVIYTENKITSSHISRMMMESNVEVGKIGEKTTVVQVTLLNGFTITESSSCVDPANYDETIGRSICLNRIENKLWELEGYVLQNIRHYSKK